MPECPGRLADAAAKEGGEVMHVRIPDIVRDLLDRQLAVGQELARGLQSHVGQVIHQRHPAALAEQAAQVPLAQVNLRRHVANANRARKVVAQVPDRGLHHRLGGAARRGLELG